MLTEKIWDSNLDGLVTILIGQSASENWSLIDQSQAEDLWFHVENQPSCHVVIRVPPQVNLSKQTLKSAALLCKQHSKACNLHRVTIIYTQIRHVTKGKSVGSVHLTKQTQRYIL